MAPDSKGKIGWRTAAAIVVANMVGTGVFTSLGFQLIDVQNTWSIALLWVLGGLISILGALSYAELGTHLPRSGGEYHFLSETMHPLVGYLSGWISLTVGFSAPVALAAMAMGAYLGKFTGFPAELIALSTVLVIAAVHSYNIRQSSIFQDVFTVCKVLLIAGLALAGLLLPASGGSLDWSDGWRSEVFTPVFAVALVYVTYSFSGWNAAAYIVEEIEAPRRNLPRALIGGALMVAVIYVLLQLAFLRQAPLDELQGRVEVGQVFAEHMLGPTGGRWVSFGIAFLLVSSISAMIWVGPRVIRTIAEDYPLWGALAHSNRHGVPVRAVWLLAGLSMALILTRSFETVLLYSGFVLELSTTLTVASVFILRRKGLGKAGFRSPGYPWVQLIYLLVGCWILIFLLIDKPRESMLGGLNLLVGAGTYGLSRWWYGKASS